MTLTIEEEIITQQSRGVLIILTGPTGAGKDTVIEKLTEKNPTLLRVTTTSSREMRPNESEGHPYHFISRDEFEKKIAQNEFFEWVEFRGELYGTTVTELDQALSSGRDIVWKIEMKGIKNIKSKIKQTTDRNVFIFLTGDTIQTLEDRVSHDPGGKHKRWNESIVQWEMSQYDDCDYLVVNTDGKLEETTQKVLAIIEAKRMEIITASKEE
jgi:guanylate kinase